MITDSTVRPESGNVGKALVRAFLGFFILIFLNGDQKSIALTLKSILITNLWSSEGCRR
jgi:hypothetical protein